MDMSEILSTQRSELLVSKQARAVEHDRSLKIKDPCHLSNFSEVYAVTLTHCLARVRTQCAKSDLNSRIFNRATVAIAAGGTV
jgi:hypothetical protein